MGCILILMILLVLLGCIGCILYMNDIIDSTIIVVVSIICIFIGNIGCVFISDYNTEWELIDQAFLVPIDGNYLEIEGDNYIYREKTPTKEKIKIATKNGSTEIELETIETGETPYLSIYKKGESEQRYVFYIPEEEFE